MAFLRPRNNTADAARVSERGLPPAHETALIQQKDAEVWVKQPDAPWLPGIVLTPAPSLSVRILTSEVSQ